MLIKWLMKGLTAGNKKTVALSIRSQADRMPGLQLLARRGPRPHSEPPDPNKDAAAIATTPTEKQEEGGRGGRRGITHTLPLSKFATGAWGSRRKFEVAASWSSVKSLKASRTPATGLRGAACVLRISDWRNLRAQNHSSGSAQRCVCMQHL